MRQLVLAAVLVLMASGAQGSSYLDIFGTVHDPIQADDQSVHEYSGPNLEPGVVAPNAQLAEADLIYADLTGADLGDAWLTGANLSGPNLYLAGLHGTDLTGADLSGASLHCTGRG